MTRVIAGYLASLLLLAALATPARADQPHVPPPPKPQTGPGHGATFGAGLAPQLSHAVVALAARPRAALPRAAHTAPVTAAQAPVVNGSFAAAAGRGPFVTPKPEGSTRRPSAAKPVELPAKIPGAPAMDVEPAPPQALALRVATRAILRPIAGAAGGRRVRVDPRIAITPAELLGPVVAVAVPPTGASAARVSAVSPRPPSSRENAVAWSAPSMNAGLVSVVSAPHLRTLAVVPAHLPPVGNTPALHLSAVARLPVLATLHVVRSAAAQQNGAQVRRIPGAPGSVRRVTRIPSAAAAIARHVLMAPLTLARRELRKATVLPVASAAVEVPETAAAPAAQPIPVTAQSSSGTAGAGGHGGTSLLAYLDTLLLLCSFFLLVKGRAPSPRRLPSLTFAPLVPPG